MTLARGDFVLLYTDGVTEAADAQSNEFGVERMMQIVRDNRNCSAGEIITAVKTDLDTLRKARPNSTTSRWLRASGCEPSDCPYYQPE